MKKLIATICSLFVGVTAFADGSHEILFSGTIGDLIFQSSKTQISVGAGYNGTLGVGQGIQLGARGSVNHLSPRTTYRVLAGPTFNFPMSQGLDDAFFVGAGAGFDHGSTGVTSSTDFVFDVFAGKRFEIVDHVSYRPQVSFTKVSGKDAEVRVSLLSFSAIF